jgi:hypothetical protein
MQMRCAPRNDGEHPRRTFFLCAEPPLTQPSPQGARAKNLDSLLLWGGVFSPQGRG